MMQLRMLGGLELTSGAGTAVSSVLAQPRRTALLCYLALTSQRGFCSRDTLYALFWPDSDTEQARHALRQALYFLRRALGSSAIVSRGDGAVALARERVRCDVAVFDAHLEAQEPEAALRLYGGDLLPGFHLLDAPEFERWLEDERTRLRRRAGDAAWALADAREQDGEAGEAAKWGRYAAALAPADETVLRRLLMLLDRVGDRAAAVRAYEAFALNLERDYDLKPSRETRELLATLRTREGEMASDGSAGGSSPKLRVPSAPGPPMPRLSTVGGVGLRSSRTSPHRRLTRYAVATVVVATVLLAVWLERVRRTGATSRTRDEVARTVTGELDRRFGRTTGSAAPRSVTRNLTAYDLYRRGTDRARLRSDSASNEGLQLLRQAVELDSTYAAAWAGLALMHHRVGVEAPPGIRKYHNRLATEAAEKAVALDDSLAEAHLMMAKVEMVAFRFEAAERHLSVAIALDPANPEPHEFMVTLLLWLGRASEALAHGKRAAMLAPMSPYSRVEIARALLGADRCDEALAMLDTLSKLRPPLLRVADVTAQCHARLGQWSAAIDVLRSQVDQGMPTALAQTAFMLAHAGRREDATRLRATLLERWRRGEIGAFQLGLASSGLGEIEQALSWFHLAIDDGSLHGSPGSPGHMMLVVPGPLSDDLRGHPEWGRLRERLGLSPTAR